MSVLGGVTVVTKPLTVGKVESIRVFARPWPVVKLFRECMEHDLRPDPIPDAIWNLPG
jgi:hypothetical protein